jgi:hypothetical protein
MSKRKRDEDLDDATLFEYHHEYGNNPSGYVVYSSDNENRRSTSMENGLRPNTIVNRFDGNLFGGQPPKLFYVYL